MLFRSRALPNEIFVIVGRESPLHPGYKVRLLTEKPENVTYLESEIRACPEILEEAKVYLYTGLEPGIGIALVESIGAGCIPVTPSLGGGGEVLRAAKVGFQYRSLDEAVTLVRNALHDTTYRPEELRQQAKIFSPEHFETRIRELL